MPQASLQRLAWLTLVTLLFAGPAWGQNPNVTVDDQPTAEQRLEEVLDLRRAKRYAQAAELVQELIESAQFKLVSLGEGHYADAGSWASDILLRDSALRQAYTERYSAAAARAYEQANASDDRLADLLGVYRRYSATPSGLEAALTAAGLLLESGQAQSAATLIDQLQRHPDRAQAKARVLMLRGAAAAYRQDSEVLEEVTEDLAEIDAQKAGQLAALVESIVPRTIAVGPAQMDMGPKPVSIRMPLWDQALAEIENANRWMLDDRLSAPVVTPAMVLIHNGRQVVAMDRASGQRAWASPGDDDSTVQKIITAQRWQDDRSVARAQGKVAAVLGECHGITERRNPYVPPNTLVCLDEQTGKPLWQRVAGEFRDDEPTLSTDRRAGRLNLQHTHFLGTPLISHGKVFVVMRRANSEGDSQSSWLMAYDAVDGSLLWYRHLALVALSYTNADSMRVSPSLTLYGDTIYMSDALGTVGAIDLHTGGFRWLRILPIGSENTRSIVANTRGVGSAPVLTSAGLLVPLSLSNDRLMLVDPADGSVLRSFKEDPVLGKTQSILATNAGVLAVSQTAASLWDADKGAVAWTFAFGAGEVMRGRGAASLRFAVLPTSQRLVVLDLATGEVLEDAPEMMGSVVVHDGEVIGIGEGRVHAYTSWDRVYQRLVDQVESRPMDPAAGLSLASIAMRQADQAQSVLLGVGHALDAVARQPARRKAAVASHVFDQLRLLIPQAEDKKLRVQLYDCLALVTQSALQEATYHLDAGLYFAGQGDSQRAVDHFHAVIAEPAFAAASYEVDGLARPAGALAQREILALIKRFGRGVYARQDAMAQARINELKAAGNLNAASLTRITQRYPLSPLAGQLLLEAAQGRAQEGRWIAAAGLYKQAVQRAVDDAQRQHAAGQLLLFYLETGRPNFATDFLDRFAQQYPDNLATIDGQAISIEQWRKRISDVQVQPIELGALASSLSMPVLINGKLIGDAPGVDTLWDRGRVYLHHGNHTVSCRGADAPGEALWTAKVPAESGRLLRLADEHGQVLFWAVDASEVLAFDAATGEPLWQAQLQFDASEGQAAAGQAGGLAEAEVLVAVSETVICFGHRDIAQVMAIDRASGLLLWRTTLEMTSLTALDADNWSLVAVGRAGHPQQLRSGKLAVLSLADAQPLLDQGEVRIALTPFGVELDQHQAIVLGVSGVMAIELPTGQTRWSHRFSEKMLTGAYAALDGRLAVETNDGEVHLLDTSNEGKALGAVAVRGGGERLPTQLQTIGGAMWCLSSRGVFRFGQAAALDWSDAIQTPGLTPRSLIVGQEHVALLAQPNEAAVKNGLELFILESTGGRLVQQYDIGPLDGPAQGEQAVRFGSGLAIPVGMQTLVIPVAKPGN